MNNLRVVAKVAFASVFVLTVGLIMTAFAQAPTSPPPPPAPAHRRCRRPQDPPKRHPHQLRHKRLPPIRKT